MLVAVRLADGDACYFAKANIKRDDFCRSIQLISQDDDAGWCKIANGLTVKANDGSKHCAIHTPNYVASEEPAE
ncbi:hypothetical protein [Thioclava sp.]|uniref:hypothetical protein n=1 Tax=Thioclava sp. TaxID=1933450 RepID=UPI003AA7DFD7